MDLLFEGIFKVFNLEYIFSVIIGTYFLIKLVDYLNGAAKVPTWLKRVITFGNGAVMFLIFRMCTDIPVQTLAASYFAAVFVYDTAIKFLIKKFNIDYKK